MSMVFSPSLTLHPLPRFRLEFPDWLCSSDVGHILSPTYGGTFFPALNRAQGCPSCTCALCVNNKLKELQTESRSMLHANILDGYTMMYKGTNKMKPQLLTYTSTSHTHRMSPTIMILVVGGKTSPADWTPESSKVRAPARHHVYAIVASTCARLPH